MSKIQRLLAFISPLLVAGFVYEPVRRYTFMALAALGALYALALSLASLPGRVGRIALAVATDLEAIRGAIPAPPAEAEKPKTPPTIPPVAGVLLLAIGLAGCPGAITPEAVGSGVLTFAEANRVIADACGEASVFVASQKGADAGQKVLDVCKQNHARVHAAMLVFADGVDAWRKGKAGAPACAALDARIALLESIDATRLFGGAIPARVDDFVSFFGTIVTNATLGECKR